MSQPDERAFRADVAKPAFRLAQAEGRWRLVQIAWPFVQIAVRASDAHDYVLRLNCAGYPQDPPTGGPWDADTEKSFRSTVAAKQRGPSGHRVRPDWKGGTALYLPCDRESIAGHDNWRLELPSKIWRPATGINQYLELVHELLNCPDLFERLYPPRHELSCSWFRWRRLLAKLAAHAVWQPRARAAHSCSATDSTDGARIVDRFSMTISIPALWIPALIRS